MTYPYDYYYQFFLTTTDTWYYSGDVPYDLVNFQNNVYYLKDNNKYSIYGSVIQDYGGYCNWMLDQNFQLNQTNYYNLDLNQSLDMVNFSTSRPIEYLYLYGYWNQRKSDLLLYRKSTYGNGETNHDVYYPLSMPLSDLRFRGSYYEYDSYYSYTK